MMGMKQLSSFLTYSSQGWGGAPTGGGCSAKSWKTRGTSHEKIREGVWGWGGRGAVQAQGAVGAKAEINLVY